MIDGLSPESEEIVRNLQPEPTLEQYQELLQPRLQSVRDRLAAARQNVADLENEEQRHVTASNELSARMGAQG